MKKLTQPLSLCFKIMNNGERETEGDWDGWGEQCYDSIENCAVNKLVGLSCFPRLQPAGTFVCLFACLSLHCSVSFNAGLSVISGQPK